MQSGGMYWSTNNGIQWNRHTSFDAYSQIFGMTLSPEGTILVASTDGLLRSTDNGTTWNNIKIQGQVTRTFSINILHNAGIVIEAYGVYHSTDDGLTWTPYYFNGSPIQYPLKSAYNSSGNAFMTTSGPVLRSTDGEVTWKCIGVPTSTVYSLSINRHGKLFANTGLFFKSSDSGGTWGSDSSLGGNAYTVILIDTNDNIYTAHRGAGFYRSTDDGHSWSFIGQSSSPWNINAIAVNHRGHIYVNADGGAYRSNDGGTTWGSISGGFPRSFTTIITDGSGILYAGTGSGIFRSTDDGDTWSASNTGLTNLGVMCAVSGPNGDILVSTSQYTSSSVLFHSLNHGQAWICISDNLSDKTINSLVMNQIGHIFVSTPSGVYRSKDLGLTWNVVSSGMLQSPPSIIASDSDGILYIGTSGDGIFRSDKPTTQFMLNTALVNFGTVHLGVTIDDTITVTNLSKENLNIASIYSTDPVFTIQPISTLMQAGEKKQFIISFSPTDQKTYSPSVVFISSSNTSPDTLFPKGAGQAPSFIHIKSTKVSFGAVALGSFIDTTIEFNNLGFDTLRIYHVYSSDVNFTALAVQVSLVENQLGHFTIRFSPTTFGSINGYIIIQSNSLRSSDTIQVFGSGGIENKGGIPSSFYLQQNYPNPFNGTISIPFGLPYSSRATISIFNIRGQLCETILDGYLNAGRYELKWHPTTLASGVYFYRLSASSFRSTNKMILLK
jgi:photosystem II stability/assembly factor-like uncharacterized protein